MEGIMSGLNVEKNEILKEIADQLKRIADLLEKEQE